jgi:hypothetical protein
MAEPFLTFGATLVGIWVIIAIHEYGHYVAGRNIVEIPKESITVVEPYFPRYVALHDGAEWVSPRDLDQYRRTYEQYDPDGEHIERFLAAGELIQAAVVVPIAVAVGLLVSVEIGVVILLLSLLSTAAYVAIDLIATLYTGTPSGDYSQLWETTPLLPILLLLGFASLHVIPLLFLT